MGLFIAFNYINFSFTIGALKNLGQYILKSDIDSNDTHIKTVYGCILNEKFIEALNTQESKWKETSGAMLVDFPMKLSNIKQIGEISPLLKDEVFHISQRVAISILT